MAAFNENLAGHNQCSCENNDDNIFSYLGKYFHWGAMYNQYHIDIYGRNYYEKGVNFIFVIFDYQNKSN